MLICLRPSAKLARDSNRRHPHDLVAPLRSPCVITVLVVPQSQMHNHLGFCAGESARDRATRRPNRMPESSSGAGINQTASFTAGFPGFIVTTAAISRHKSGRLARSHLQAVPERAVFVSRGMN